MTTATTRIMPAGDDKRTLPGPRSRVLRVGTVLWNRYEITAVLGTSSLGEVWRCTDRQTGKQIALRQLPPDIRRSKQAMAILHSGIRRISHQQHPNLAVIRQMIYMGDQIYLAGDFAPGVDIGTWGRVGVGGKRTVEEVIPKLRQVAEALDLAHRLKVIHRNLKSSNIYLASDGLVRVTDFCLAPPHHLTLVRGHAVRATDESSPYQAPEVKAGEEADSASDQYSLAAVAWLLLTGEPPDPDKIENPPAELPRAARLALRRALSPKPRNRFVTCADFVRALGGETVKGRRGRSRAEWRKLGWRLGVAAALVVLAGGLWGGVRVAIWWANRPPPAPPEIPLPKVTPMEKAKKEAATPPPVVPLVATTPLPVEGKPWVAHTVPMEFVWVAPMQMWVGRFEVTNEEYRQKDPEHSSGDYQGINLSEGRQPVVCVNFEDTVAYAEWLTERERAAGKLREGWRYRLPSRAEAVAYTRAGFSELNYPWGERWPPSRGNYADAEYGKVFSDQPIIPDYNDGFVVTAPVEFSGENNWGIFGAGGNVWETTSKEPGGNTFGGWHGGGWNDHLPARLKSDTFYGFLGNARGAVNGFRLVLAPIAGEAPKPAATAAVATAASASSAN